jgi:putative transposase
MIVNKTYKLRIYPNKSQTELMAKHFGSTRFVWNHFLAQRKEAYLEDKKSLNYHDNAKALTLLKKELAWLTEVNSQALQASLKDLDTAYGRFFKKIAKFPRFKSKRDAVDSFRCPQSIDIREGKLSIPKFREGIKIKIHREIAGRILFATISRTSTGRYFAAITCEVEHEVLPSTDKKIGIDLGIKDKAICSDGVVFKNINTTKKYAKKLAFTQRQLSKKQIGSGKRLKQRKKVAVVHETIRNARLDNIHKTTHTIISESQAVIVENLNVSGMIKNHKLAKAIADASWYEFVRQLEYKAKWNKRDFVKIDRWFPSSKTCNNCNFINQTLLLKDRIWTCPECKTVLNRDLNAAKNILKQGLKILSGSGADSDVKQKPVEPFGN